MRREVRTPAAWTERKVYYDHQRYLARPEAAEAWRARIPFTNAQVIAALQAIAAETHERSRAHWRAIKGAEWIAASGRLSQKLLNMAVPRLVTTCGVCRQPATRRYGYFGRCDRHAHLVPREVDASLERLTRRSADIAATKRQRDYRDLNKK